jgi:amidophosphoribosyltransferase
MSGPPTNSHSLEGPSEGTTAALASPADSMVFDKLREECGIFGIYGDKNAARLTSLGLHALQHRGQEGAGIAVTDGSTIQAVRAKGLVGEALPPAAVETLKGTAAIGHVRYATTGESSLRNVQPFLVRYRDGQLAIAHNGNLVNAARLRRELEARGSIFASTSDTEVILHLLATSQQSTFVNRLVEALYKVEGAWSLLLLTEERMVAVRDPRGFRPLVLGRRKDAWVVASESCALQLIEAELVREIAPGEMLIIDKDGLRSLHPWPQVARTACVFEHIYFSRPDSQVFGASVYQTRKALGRRLGEEAPALADVVIPVPDSGIPGAMGFAEASGLPFEVGLLRSHYMGRSFIEPTQEIRDFAVKMKLSPNPGVIAGQRLVVVDDSLVRGTTSQKIVRMLRMAGAAEVHLRITAPPTRGSCFYGVDTPDPSELIATRMDLGSLCSWLGADSLAYLSLEGLHSVVGQGGFCDACFSLRYPVESQPEVAPRQLGLFSSDAPPQDGG